jgi:hypothetical protein
MAHETNFTCIECIVHFYLRLKWDLSTSRPLDRATLDAFRSVAIGTGIRFSVVADVQSIAVETIVFAIQAQLRIWIAALFIVGMVNA